jgi:hypothetical protein
MLLKSSILVCALLAISCSEEVIIAQPSYTLSNLVKIDMTQRAEAVSVEIKPQQGQPSQVANNYVLVASHNTLDGQSLPLITPVIEPPKAEQTEIKQKVTEIEDVSIIAVKKEGVFYPSVIVRTTDGKAVNTDSGEVYTGP